LGWEEDEELRRLREARLRELMRRLAERERERKVQMPDKPVEITEKGLNDVIKRYDLVVVDFWAPWCAPCLMMAPIIEELAKHYAGKVVFAKLNVDENPRAAMRFDIRAIPTFLVFKRGRLVARWLGAMPKEALMANIDGLLARRSSDRRRAKKRYPA